MKNEKLKSEKMLEKYKPGIESIVFRYSPKISVALLTGKDFRCFQRINISLSNPHYPFQNVHFCL